MVFISELVSRNPYYTSCHYFLSLSLCCCCCCSFHSLPPSSCPIHQHITSHSRVHFTMNDEDIESVFKTRASLFGLLRRVHNGDCHQLAFNGTLTKHDRFALMHTKSFQIHFSSPTLAANGDAPSHSFFSCRRHSSLLPFIDNCNLHSMIRQAIVYIFIENMLIAQSSSTVG